MDLLLGLPRVARTAAVNRHRIRTGRGRARRDRCACPRPVLLITAAATAATAATAVSGTATVFARPGLVDGQGAAARFFAIEGVDGGQGLLVGLHLDEGEALGPSG